MKPSPEYTEGTDAWTRFTGAMRKVLAADPQEVRRKIAEHKKESNANPKKRGPKQNKTAI